MSTPCNVEYPYMTHDDGTIIRCTLAPHVGGDHVDDSHKESTGELMCWHVESAADRQADALPITPPSPTSTVRELRAYARHYGVSLPSRIRKSDLVDLVHHLRHGNYADAYHAVTNVNGTISSPRYHAVKGDQHDAAGFRSTWSLPSSADVKCEFCATLVPFHAVPVDGLAVCADSTCRQLAGRPVVVCEWFVGCDRPAVGHADHVVIGPVPVCAPCSTNLLLNVTPF